MKQYLSAAEIKHIEFEILCNFSKYCDDNNLRYYLCGGTLLGAIRHKGFIPWDDDIDVLMPREDYEKFLRLNFVEKVFSVGTIRDGSSNIPFVKIFNTNTFIDQKYSHCINMDHLWIDVFPMDGVPQNEIKKKILFKKARFLRKMLGISESKIGTGTTLPKRFVKTVMYIPCSLIGARRWASWLDKVAQTYSFEESVLVGGVAWGYGPQETMIRSQYVPYAEVEFEGELFHAPMCYDTYLSNLYGNYMQLPPENQRLDHSMVAWINI